MVFDTYPSDRDEMNGEMLIEYLKSRDPRVGDIYRRITKFAQIYVRNDDTGRPTPEETRLTAVRDTIVPMIVTAMGEAGWVEPETHIKWGRGEGQHGGYNDNAKNHAAKMIYDEIVKPEIERFRADRRENEEIRAFAIAHGYQPGSSQRRTLGSVLDIPEKTIGHHIEERVNAAAKKAGFLGRR